jgi:hypothetical protein
MLKNNQFNIAKFDGYIVAFPLFLLIIVGVFQGHEDPYQLLSYEHNHNMLMLIGLTTGCAVVLLMPMLLATRDSMMRAFAYGIFVFIPMAVLIWNGVIYYNCSQDKTEAKLMPAKVWSKDSFRSRSGVNYTLILTNKNYDNSLRVRVTKAFYETSTIGAQVRLHIKNGALGFKWVESYEMVS